MVRIGNLNLPLNFHYYERMTKIVVFFFELKGQNENSKIIRNGMKIKQALI